jgi:hypothetical protein
MLLLTFLGCLLSVEKIEIFYIYEYLPTAIGLMPGGSVHIK